MSEVIVITSGKGGVGKTTTSANVGTGLAMLGKRVVLIDTDIGLRNLDVVMGLENRIIYNLVDVIEGNCRMKQALIRDKRYPDLFLLPSAQTRDKSSVSPGQMIKLVEDLSDEDILNIARKINNMPRKALGYKTPLEVFENNLKKKGIDTSFLDIYRIKIPICLVA